MSRRNLLVSIPEYWAIEPRKRPRTYQGLMKRISRKGGFWQVLQRDELTGEVITEQWCENCITNNGVAALIKNTFYYASQSVAVGNIIAIDASLGIATVGAIASGGTVTSISVTALTGPTIPSGTTLLINPGNSNKLLVSLTQAITGAGTYTVASTPGPSSAISAGSFARYATASDVAGTALSSMPTTDAAPTSPVSYSAALPSGQFTLGTRQIQIAASGNYLFSTQSNSNPATATTGTYTALWLVNANPATSSNTMIHLPFDAPLTISGNLTIQATATENF